MKSKIGLGSILEIRIDASLVELEAMHYLCGGFGLAHVLQLQVLESIRRNCLKQ